jgi:hypothetical protein
LIIDAGMDLFMAIIDALPVIVEAGSEAIPQIIDAVIGALIDAIPQLIEAGIKLFVSIVKICQQSLQESLRRFQKLYHL